VTAGFYFSVILGRRCPTAVLNLPGARIPGESQGIPGGIVEIESRLDRWKVLKKAWWCVNSVKKMKIPGVYYMPNPANCR